jgi:hypothetical protein
MDVTPTLVIFQGIKASSNNSCLSIFNDSLRLLPHILRNFGSSSLLKYQLCNKDIPTMPSSLSNHLQDDPSNQGSSFLLLPQLLSTINLDLDRRTCFPTVHWSSPSAIKRAVRFFSVSTSTLRDFISFVRRLTAPIRI